MKTILSLSIIMMFSISVVEAASKTHLGQKVGDHVVLISDFFDQNDAPCGSSFEDKAFFQVFPNGTQSESPFQLANGKLVITDIEWSASRTVLGGPLTPSRTLRLTIALGSSDVFLSGLTLDADSAQGRPGKSEYMTTGFVVEPGVAICPRVSQLSDAGFVVVRIERIVLRGYIIAR